MRRDLESIRDGIARPHQLVEPPAEHFFDLAGAWLLKLSSAHLHPPRPLTSPPTEARSRRTRTGREGWKGCTYGEKPLKSRGCSCTASATGSLSLAGRGFFVSRNQADDSDRGP